MKSELKCSKVWMLGWCVSGDLVFWEGTEGLGTGTIMIIPLRKLGDRNECVNNRGTSPLRTSCKGFSKCPEKRCLAIIHDWTETRRYPQRFTSWLYHYRRNFHIPACFRKVLILCKGCGHIFSWTGKSILFYPVNRENFLRCALGVRWWRPFLLAVKLLYTATQVFVSVSAGSNHKRSVRVWKSHNGVCCHQSSS